MAICTFLAPFDKGSDHVAVSVNFEKAFGLDCRSPLRTHQRRKGSIILFDRFGLTFFEWGSAIAYYAAAALAERVIAGEIFGKDF